VAHKPRPSQAQGRATRKAVSKKLHTSLVSPQAHRASSLTLQSMFERILARKSLTEFDPGTKKARWQIATGPVCLSCWAVWTA